MDEKQCPFCAETIKAQASKCKHCGAELSEQTETATDKQKSDFKDGKPMELKAKLSTHQLLIHESEFNKKRRSKLVAYLLYFFFFGIIGSHQAYLHNSKSVTRYWVAAGLVILGFLMSFSISSPDSGEQAVISVFMFVSGLSMLAIGGFLIYDLFTLGHQTDVANERIEKDILLKVMK